MADVRVNVIAEDNFSGVLGNFGSIVTGVESLINLVGKGFEAATDLIGDFVNSASESQTALVGLQTVLDSTNSTMNFTTYVFEKWASQLQNTTMYSDEIVMSAEAMLLRFENLGPIFGEALTLTTDLAASLGMDLTAAARMVGMALDDPTAGIGRLNTQFRIFTDEQMKVIKAMAETGDIAGAQALIMQGLTEKVGGAAEAFGQTYAGQLEIARNKMDDVKETIGGAFLPVLTELLNKVIEFANQPQVIEFVNNLATSILNFVNRLPEAIAKLNELKILFEAGFTAQDVVNWLGDLDSKLAVVVSSYPWRELGDAFGESILGAFSLGIETKSSEFIPALGRAIGEFFRGAIGEVWFENSAQDMASGFVRLVIDAIKANFNASMQWTKDIASNIITSFFTAIRTNFMTSVNWLKDMINDYIIKPIKDALGISSPSTVFMGIGKSIIDGLKDGFINNFSNLLTTVKGKIQDLIDLFPQKLKEFLGLSTSTSGTFYDKGEADNTLLSPTTGTLTTTAVQNYYNYYYGTVNFNGTGQTNGGVDCQYPNPVLGATSTGLPIAVPG